MYLARVRVFAGDIYVVHLTCRMRVRVCVCVSYQRSYGDIQPLSCRSVPLFLSHTKFSLF